MKALPSTDVPNSTPMRIAWLLVVLTALISIGLVLSGVPLVGYDAYFHLNNLAQYSALHDAGTLIPRWTPNSYYGFGSATFYFYPPLTYFASAIIYLMNGSFAWSLRLLSLSTMGLSAWTLSAYLRTIGSKGSNVCLAVCSYAFGPYAFYDLFVRSNYAEYLSLAIIPFLFYGVELCLSSDRAGQAMKAIGILSLGCTVLFLTSIPTSVLMFSILPLYIFSRVRGRWVFSVTTIVVSVGVSVACCAINLLPILHFQHDAHLAFVSAFGQNKWFRSSFFSSIASGTHLTDSFFALFMVLCAGFLWILWMYRWRSERKPMSVGWIVILGIVLLAQVPFVTESILRFVPILGLIQFPSRFFVFIGISLAVYISESTKDNQWKHGFTLVSIAAAAVLVFGLLFLALHPIRTMHEFPIEQKAQWSAYEYSPAQTSNDPAKVLGFTKLHQNDPSIEALRVIPPVDILQQLNTLGNTSHFRVVLHDSLTVRFNHFYWPQWQLSTSAGQMVRPLCDSNGVLTATLPRGSYILTLEIVQSEAERSGLRISIVGLSVLIMIYACGTMLEVRRKRSR